jgi:hypothetical protein
MERLFKKILYVLFYYRVWFACRRKIKKLVNFLRLSNNLIKLNYSVIKEHKLYLKNIISNPVNIHWIKAYISISGKTSPCYIPEDVYYLGIEPRLNDYSLARAYADKNFYERFLIEFKEVFVSSLLRKINGILYDSEFNLVNKEKISSIIESEEKFIIKPSLDSGGGRGVEIIDFIKKADSYKNHENILTLSSFNENFVLQGIINQHPFFAQFNTSSVNTVRLLAYRSVENNEVEVIQGVLRIGVSGSHVDNQASGGVACGFDLVTGKLNDFVSNKYGKVFKNFNGIDFSEHRTILHLEEMKRIASLIASRYYYFRLLSFDFCMDKNNNVKLIELNTKNHEINFYQFNNGPLFGNYTDEILKYCYKRKKSFVLDYEI